MNIQALIDARKRKRWSQQRLADKSGISATYINEIERGKRRQVSLSAITALCKPIGIPVSVIAGDMTLDEWERYKAFTRLIKRWTNIKGKTLKGSLRE